MSDPYRWLEDGNSQETKSWVKAQNELSSAYLDRIPERAAIRERVARLWNFEKYLVSRDGNVIKRFASRVAPDSAEMINAIESALALVGVTAGS